MTEAATRSPRNRRAAFTLIVITPLIAELALGVTPISMAWLVLLWMPIYGAGVLFLREVVTRRGRGWPSILVLALAYELLEDGIGLQALTSPNLYHAAEWGLRLFGFNTPYWVANTIYHATFTLVIPIALTNLLFPGHTRRPYLGRVGLTVTGIVAALGVLLLRTVGLSQDPGYQTPLPFVVGVLVVVAALFVIALVVLPAPSHRVTSTPVPGLATLFTVATLATWLFFFLTFPIFDAKQPAFTSGNWVLLPMIGATILAAGAVRTITRLSRSSHWTPRHTLWLAGGALVGHSLGGIVVMSRTLVDGVGLAVITVITVVLLVLLDRRLKRQSAVGSTPPPN